MNIRAALKSVGIGLLLMAFGSLCRSQEKSGLPEFFGFYALDNGQNVAVYEGQGAEGAPHKEAEEYSIPQNSKFNDSMPQISTSARFVLFYSNSGEMIQSMSLYKLPFVRQIIETLPADAFNPPTRHVVDSPNVPLLARIPELADRLLAKPIPNQPQMVELVPSQQLTPGLYVIEYGPAGQNGWAATFAVSSGDEGESPYCIDLILPGGPRGLFERANSELNAWAPLLAPYRYTKCDSSGPASGEPVTGSSSGPSGNSSAAAAAPWTDPATGLMWTSADNNADLTFDQAVDYCKNLRLGGYSNWRLPEIEELQGISDPSANVPANRPDVVALHIPGLPGPVHIKGNISISGGEMSNTGKPPAELQTFDFGSGKVRLLKNTKHRQIRALCVRNPK
ncbi:MAG: Lcl C-terminal domain-containing protein [Acidimicrobiales bacterium]